MNDTPQHIKDLKLSIWMSKTPEERLLQFLTENEQMWMALRKAKKEMGLPLTQSGPYDQPVAERKK